MDNTINATIIEKVTIKSVAIYKAITMLPPLETKDLWAEKNLIEHQNSCENKSVSEINDTTNDTKMPSTQNDWKDITDPKLRKKMYLKHWNKVNRVKARSYYHKNKPKNRLQQKEYYSRVKDKRKLQVKVYRKNNRTKINENRKRWYVKNKNEIQYKLKKTLRSRLHSAIKLNQKSGSALKDLGCTISELKTYLESKFQPGMSWDNWGIYGWHIDHIKPLSSFDLKDRKQLLEACHYTNLQPLWAQDNLAKGDTL